MVDTKNITPELMNFIQAEFRLPWESIHGYDHWVRVLENGLRLADLTGANRTLIELFAFLHDVRRENEGYDLNHGPLAAELVEPLNGRFYHLPPLELGELKQAIHYHSHGLMQASVTVQTCWDADRLDLGRVGIKPMPERLCTPAARQIEILEWAWKRSTPWGW